MDKPKFETPNLTSENVAKIAELFPGVVAEGKVNFDLLRSLLGDDVFGDEAYEFTWVGKRAAIAEAGRPIRKTLRPCVEESKDWDTTENLYIEGDNLDVLKLLQESYLGKVKMIYIDPPYNTGSDFIYRDNFAQSREEYEEEAGAYNEDGDRLFRNTETNGRFHSDWCSMIYPRLVLARNLLCNDGVIFISIDDNEVVNVIKICNEVFNESNYVGTLVLQTATDNNPRQINTEHEYMICYAKSKPMLPFWQSENEKIKLIQTQYLSLRQTHGDDCVKIQKELRTWIKENASELEGVAHYDNVDSKGVFHDGDVANTVFGGYEYTVFHPVTGKPCKIPEKGFRFAESTMREMIANDEIMFGDDETTLIKPKKRLENARDALRSIIYEDGRTSTKKFEQLMARDIFQNPKSDTILGRLIKFVANDGDIILDFFSGSATTAESVMAINYQLKTRIKFIMVQLVENLDESLKTTTSRTKKTLQNAISFLDTIGKPHTIPEIGKERIRRAGEKIKAEAGLTAQNLDIGFRVLKLDETNMNDVYYAAGDYTQDLVSEMEGNIKSDRSGLDLLYGCLLDWGLPLSMPHTHEKIDGFTVHTYNNGDLIACFEERVSEKAIREIAGRKPLRAVFRDSGFAGSPEKINVFEIFKMLAPNTSVKVI